MGRIEKPVLLPMQQEGKDAQRHFTAITAEIEGMPHMGDLTADHHRAR